ncbi:beta-L-arabinofuranosidase domain-containing protein [Ruminococcus flavefaciens]|uniref:beta-L-arabinofuranosidase domain-containing protein n=1 Tax=Ruminococcus flavefaciens TaxID=1265 RepID=UPI0004ADECD2|nr:beta-L-arabinofuranosidase domain-containing protein [Ruminococcus flavefaciens]
MLSKLPSRMTSFGIAAALMFNFSDFSSFKTSAATADDMKIRDFSISDVTMTDAYSVNAFNKELDYLLAFDTNRLLAGFRENAGLNTNGAKRYGGWENTNIAGHSVGHYMTAIAQAYQNPSITEEQRSALYKRMTTLIDGLRQCQKSSKGKPGLIWAASHPNGTGVEVQFDNVEAGKSNIISEAWVPWYTMHKLIAGIVDIYDATGYATAKDLGSDLGDWVYNRCKTWNDQKRRTVLSIEYGGMNDCMYELYRITGKDNHAVAAHYFDDTNLHEQILKGGANVLNGKHANTTIPKFLGALKRYTVAHGKTINGEKVDATRQLQYAEAFWDMVVNHHTYITGGNSEWEHFGMDDILDKERTNCNCETCNSYNMLKLSRELFKITGDSKYMDFYENTYYNSILSSQNPETGMTTYFQPMATGYFKVYSSRFDHFWCCTGSGMENFSKLGDTIYMHGDNTLYVNMYQSSILNWADKNMKITQESTIPDGNTSKFTIEGSGAVDFRFRIPDWKAGNVTVKVDGEKYSYKTVNGYAQVTGDFKTDDVIEITIPEAVKAYSLPDKNTVYGFKYGPVVLSAELGKQNMATSSTGMWVTIPKEAIAPSENIRISDNNTTVNTFMADINDHLVKDANSLKFTLKGTDHDLTFTPHYKQYQQRYGIYWNFQSSSTAVDRPVRSKKVVTDTVQPGYGQYENDNLHNMQEVNTQGVTDDSTYRYAKSGGYFNYRMAVDKEADYNYLTVKFRKSDNNKTIRITVGDSVLYSNTLYYTGTEDVYDVNIMLTPDIIEKYAEHITADGTEYDVVTVGFSSENNEESAKVCDFIYITSVKPLYEYDSSIAYFVDCGDHNTYTVTGSDKLGYYNSVTEQLYGYDEVTGAEWGLVDDPTDQYNGSANSSGLYTANTWCDERNTGDGRAKNASFRYTKNQYENNIDRHIDYGFTLPNGKYSVEMCFSDPWSCSTSPTVYANYGSDEQILIAENCATNGSTVTKGEVTVKNGKLELNFRSADKAININYIIIREIEKTPLPTVTSTTTVTTTVTTTTTVSALPEPTKLGDANCDGEVDMADIVLIMQVLANPNKYGINGTDKNAVTQQGIANADVDTSSKGITNGDALMIQKYLLGLVKSLG